MWLHNCRHIPAECQYVTRIPRRKGTYNDLLQAHTHQSNCTSWVAFGIDAAYVLSSRGLFIYYAISILSGFSFWIYWMKSHPSDLQNALVPLFTIVMLVGTFWSLYGRNMGAFCDSWRCGRLNFAISYSIGVQAWYKGRRGEAGRARFAGTG